MKRKTRYLKRIAKALEAQVGIMAANFEAMENIREEEDQEEKDIEKHINFSMWEGEFDVGDY